MAEVYLDPKGYAIDPSTGSKANGAYKTKTGGTIYFKDGLPVNKNGTPRKVTIPATTSSSATPLTGVDKLLAEKKELTTRISVNSKVDITSTTAAQRLAAMKATEQDRIRLAEINNKLAGRPTVKSGKDAKGKTVAEVKQGLEANKKVADNAPAFIAGDALDDLYKWADFDFRNNASFIAGGVGSTAFVYMGEMDNPSFQGGLQFKGGTPVPKKIDQSRLGTALINDFWNDKALQSKIIGAYASKGQTISTLQAYEVWQGLVNTAATIYQGGRGAKVTPMQLLTDSLKGIKGKDTGPDVTQYISVKTDDEIKQTLKSAIFSYIQKEPKDNDPVFSKLVKDIKNLYAKGTTQTSTVNPKTGKKTVVEKGGVTAADIEARIERAYKGTDDFLEAKSLEGADLFSQWMRS